MMKQTIRNIIEKALQTFLTATEVEKIDFVIEKTKHKSFGHYACNAAMLLAPVLKKKPRDIAEIIRKSIPENNLFVDIQIAGPGFLNFYLKDAVFISIIPRILEEKTQFGCQSSTVELPQPIHIEYVSANPTGPLHVGHGRSAAFGSALCELFKTQGIQFTAEYYVNDAGRQMDILALSIWIRYLSIQLNQTLTLPPNAYQGEYVLTIAKNLSEKYEREFLDEVTLFLAQLNKQTEEIQNTETAVEIFLDDCIALMKKSLGTKKYRQVFEFGLEAILLEIKTDLLDFGVQYDNWFSEQSLIDAKLVEEVISTLKTEGHTYTENGNLWFKATEFGDEKDRVLFRKNGSATYFANDIAYHISKFKRGAKQVFDVLGADHHGYIPRVKAAMKALGFEKDQVQALFVQFAILYRGKNRVAMSTRSGSFVTLKDLQTEVGRDAARYFYLMRKNEQHLDFDLELAKSQSHENPVYYIQYAHARICSVLRQAVANDPNFKIEDPIYIIGQQQKIALLNNPEEIDLLILLSEYPCLLEMAAKRCEPHQICNYLRELAQSFHSYYNNVIFLVEDYDLRYARCLLLMALKQVFVNALTILKISAPTVM